MDFESIEVVSDDGLVKVNLDWEGEGINGDYEEDDPQDIPLLRYTIHRKLTKDCQEDSFCNLTGEIAQQTEEHKHLYHPDYSFGEWVKVRDASYCTQLPANAPREQLFEAANSILFYVEDGVRDLRHQKKQYEELSWICLVDGKPHFEKQFAV